MSCSIFIKIALIRISYIYKFLGHEFKEEKRRGRTFCRLSLFATLRIFFLLVFSECVLLLTSILSEEVKREEKEFRDVDNIPE